MKIVPEKPIEESKNPKRKRIENILSFLSFIVSIILLWSIWNREWIAFGISSVLLGAISIYFFLRNGSSPSGPIVR
tara:strand:+ start:12810 stop:13037 length:228 start_codon:yes stop_codon:yes gene_type:complete